MNSHKQQRGHSPLFTCSTLEFLAQNLIGQLGICLTTGLIHHLSDEETLQLCLAAAAGLHLIGMCP